MSLSVRTKLLGGFAAVIAVLVAALLYALSAMGGISDRTTTIGGNDLPSVQILGGYNGATSDYRAGLFKLIVTTDPAELRAVDDSLTALTKQVDDAFARYRPYISSA